MKKLFASLTLLVCAVAVSGECMAQQQVVSRKSAEKIEKSVATPAGANIKATQKNAAGQSQSVKITPQTGVAGKRSAANVNVKERKECAGTACKNKSSQTVKSTANPADCQLMKKSEQRNTAVKGTPAVKTEKATSKGVRLVEKKAEKNSKAVSDK